MCKEWLERLKTDYLASQLSLLHVAKRANNEKKTKNFTFTKKKRKIKAIIAKPRICTAHAGS